MNKTNDKVKKKGKKETREERGKKERKKIENEKRNILSNLIIRITLILFLSICCLLIYCRYTATKGLIVNEYNIHNSIIPDSFNGFKIVHFSDLRYGSTTDKETLNTLVKRINMLNPELVVFTGDIIDNNYKVQDNDIKDIINGFSAIKSYVGKYAVEGDLDNDAMVEIYSKSGFTILKNTYDTIYYKGYTPIILSGIGSMNKNEMDLTKSFQFLQEEGKKELFQICLVHESDAYLSIINNYAPHIIMTGNSLGGLLRIPGNFGLIKLEGSKGEIREFIQEGDTAIYNSFGLGTTNIKFRFFNKPSINFYRLYTK